MEVCPKTGSKGLGATFRYPCYNWPPETFDFMEPGGGGPANAMAMTQPPQYERRCPWCGSYDTRLIQRGYTGPTDEVDQYFTCNACNKVTYELVAKTAREMRLGRFRAGGVYRDHTHHTRYNISRVLRVGLNEYLIYLKPLINQEVPAGTRQP